MPSRNRKLFQDLSVYFSHKLAYFYKHDLLKLLSLYFQYTPIHPIDQAPSNAGSLSAISMRASSRLFLHIKLFRRVAVFKDLQLLHEQHAVAYLHACVCLVCQAIGMTPFSGNWSGLVAWSPTILVYRHFRER